MMPNVSRSWAEAGVTSGLAQESEKLGQAFSWSHRPSILITESDPESCCRPCCLSVEAVARKLVSLNADLCQYCEKLQHQSLW